MSMDDIINLLKSQKAENKLDIEEMFKKWRLEEKKDREKEKDSLVSEICVGIK